MPCKRMRKKWKKQTKSVDGEREREGLMFVVYIPIPMSKTMAGPSNHREGGKGGMNACVNTP